MNENQDFIKLVTSSPGLKDKIHVDIKDATDVIYWYIKFNIPLDGESVSKKTMGVTDAEGYILNTDISYSGRSNIIAIKPLEPYTQNEYYILSISKKVRSANLQNLKRDIHILFKLKNNVISEFKILPPNVKVPKPKKKPSNAKPLKSKVYSFDKYIDGGARGDYLPSASIMINPLIGTAGLIASVVSLFMRETAFIIGSVAVIIIGILHIVKQLSNKRFRSNFIYNKGVRCFKKEKYYKANVHFTRALELNPENEYAEYAKNKILYYIN